MELGILGSGGGGKEGAIWELESSYGPGFVFFTCLDIINFTLNTYLSRDSSVLSKHEIVNENWKRGRALLIWSVVGSKTWQLILPLHRMERVAYYAHVFRADCLEMSTLLACTTAFAWPRVGARAVINTW